MNKFVSSSLCLPLVLALAACGGGGGGSGGVQTPATLSLPVAADADADNALPVVVDRGPDLFLLTGRAVVNTLFASVTVCTAGNASQCETIDHVMVDTGSVGLRILASALSGTASLAPHADPAGGGPLRQCVQFADGHSWGSVVVADVQIGARKLGSLPLNLIGDPAAGAVPPTCVSGAPKNTATALGANGVLGIGNFRHDCGAACATQAVAGTYYLCPSAGAGALCRPAAVPLDHQVPNPVAAMAADNNGVTIQLPAVPQSGSRSAKGTVYFGVDTQSNNTAESARVFQLDSHGTLSTSYGGASQRAVIDSGSNGYFFNSAALAMCTSNRSFYCPVSGGVATSAPQTAAIVGRNGMSETVGFTVDNLDQLFTGQAALPGVAAPSSGMIGGSAGLFFWGLPFFYGRTVHVLLEGEALGGVAGPALAF